MLFPNPSPSSPKVSFAEKNGHFQEGEGGEGLKYLFMCIYIMLFPTIAAREVLTI